MVGIRGQAGNWQFTTVIYDALTSVPLDSLTIFEPALSA
jgi:hypothetical protein